jgi:hypothetical protein
MDKKEIARELVSCLNILSILAQEGKELTNPEVALWIKKHYDLLVQYHGGTK